MLPLHHRTNPGTKLTAAGDRAIENCGQFFLAREQAIPPRRAYFDSPGTHRGTGVRKLEGGTGRFSRTGLYQWLVSAPAKLETLPNRLSLGGRRVMLPAGYSIRQLSERL